MSDLFVDNIKHQSSQGSGTITIGASGETISVPSGATLDLSNATQTGVGGVNTPAFMAYNPQNGAVASGTNVVLSLNTELFDTDSAYDTSTYKFTPQVAGHYFFYANVRWQGATNSATRLNLDITKNGSSFANSRNSNSDYATTNATGVCYLNGSTDYVQLESYHNFAGSTGITTALNNTYLGGYKIIE